MGLIVASASVLLEHVWFLCWYLFCWGRFGSCSCISFCRERFLFLGMYLLEGGGGVVIPASVLLAAGLVLAPIPVLLGVGCCSSIYSVGGCFVFVLVLQCAALNLVC